MVSNCLNDEAVSIILAQVIRSLNQTIEEYQAFQDVGEIYRSVIIIADQEMRQDYTLGEDVLNLVEHLIALGLHTLSFKDSTLNESHTNWAQILDQTFWNRVEEELHTVKLEL